MASRKSLETAIKQAEEQLEQASHYYRSTQNLLNGGEYVDIALAIMFEGCNKYGYDFDDFDDLYDIDEMFWVQEDDAQKELQQAEEALEHFVKHEEQYLLF